MSVPFSTAAQRCPGRLPKRAKGFSPVRLPRDDEHFALTWHRLRSGVCEAAARRLYAYDSDPVAPTYLRFCKVRPIKSFGTVVSTSAKPGSSWMKSIIRPLRLWPTRTPVSCSG